MPPKKKERIGVYNGRGRYLGYLFLIVRGRYAIVQQQWAVNVATIRRGTMEFEWSRTESGEKKIVVQWPELQKLRRSGWPV